MANGVTELLNVPSGEGSLTIEFNLVPRAVLGLCMPGVSTTII
jgi:hypothetical protein